MTAAVTQQQFCAHCIDADATRRARWDGRWYWLCDDCGEENPVLDRGQERPIQNTKSGVDWRAIEHRLRAIKRAEEMDELADELGVDPVHVRKAMSRIGHRLSTRRKWWTPERLAELWDGEPDEVARRMGITVRAVKQARYRHGGGPQ